MVLFHTQVASSEEEAALGGFWFKEMLQRNDGSDCTSVGLILRCKLCDLHVTCHEVYKICTRHMPPSRVCANTHLQSVMLRSWAISVIYQSLTLSLPVLGVQRRLLFNIHGRSLTVILSVFTVLFT